MCPPLRVIARQTAKVRMTYAIGDEPRQSKDPQSFALLESFVVCLRRGCCSPSIEGFSPLQLLAVIILAPALTFAVQIFGMRFAVRCLPLLKRPLFLFCHRVTGLFPSVLLMWFAQILHVHTLRYVSPSGIFRRIMVLSARFEIDHC